MQFSGKLVIIAALAVTVLLVSNIIASKPVALFTLPFNFIGSNLFVVSAAEICFPVSYIISDILTEVYGFRTARGVIWLGFVCNLLMVFLFWAGGIIPGAGFWENQAAYETILGATTWILLGSFIAYLVGEFTNAVVMVLLKNRTQGRMLWLRHHFLHGGGTGNRLDTVLHHRVRHFGAVGGPGRVVAAGVQRGGVRLGRQVAVRDHRHSVDLPGGGLAEAHRADGRLRRAALTESLRRLRQRPRCQRRRRPGLKQRNRPA